MVVRGGPPPSRAAGPSLAEVGTSALGDGGLAPGAGANPLFVDYTTSNVVQRTLARGAIASGLTYTGDGSIIAGGPAQHDYMQYYQKYMKSNHIFDGAGAGATADTRGPSEDAGKGLKGGGYCDDDYVRTGAGSRSFKGKGCRESFSTVCAYSSDDVVIDEGGTTTRATQTGDDGGVDDDEYGGSGSGSASTRFFAAMRGKGLARKGGRTLHEYYTSWARTNQ